MKHLGTNTGRDTVTPPAAAVGVVRTARAELPQAQTEI